MAITIVIPQDIGTNHGAENDGVIVGEIAHQDFNAESYFSFAHMVLYAYQDNNNSPISNTNTWTPYADELNAKTPIEPFSPIDPSNDIPTFYLAVREGITGFSFNVSTAATGTPIFQAFYNSEDDGYIEIPEYVLSSNFLEQTGIATIFFTPPADWAEDYIGNISIPPQRWLRIQLAGGFITGQPEITGGWEMSTILEETSPPVVNTPFINPYTDLLPGDGDTLYLSSENKPYGMIITYQNPLAQGVASYLYSKVDGTFATLIPISDTSEGLTYDNEVTVTLNALSTTTTGADSATAEALTGAGYINAVVDTLPTTTNDIISIGLSSALTGAIDYELAIKKPAGAAVYQRIEGGVVVETSTQVATAGDVMSVFRYEGKIYYKVNDADVFDVVDIPETTDNLYGRVFATNTTAATQDIEIYVWDWSNRLAVNLDVTFNNADFINTTSTELQSLPGHYYIQFVPPTNFASLTELLSKTGEAGYEIGIQSNFMTLPANNIVLMDQKVLTIDADENVFFPVGNQTVVQIMNMLVQNPENITTDQSFLLIINTGTGEAVRQVTYSPEADNSGIFTSAVATVGVVGIIIVQVDGDAELTVGIPSEFYLAP